MQHGVAVMELFLLLVKYIKRKEQSIQIDAKFVITPIYESYLINLLDTNTGIYGLMRTVCDLTTA